MRCPKNWFLLCRTERQLTDCQTQSCPQSPIENQADSTVVSKQIPAASPAPWVHKPKKPNDDFPLQKNNIAQPSLPGLERFLYRAVPAPARQSRQDEMPSKEPGSFISFSWKAQKKFGCRKSLPSLLIKLISAGQESGRRGTADTRLAKLLGEMVLISHPGGERQEVIQHLLSLISFT